MKPIQKIYFDDVVKDIMKERKCDMAALAEITPLKKGSIKAIKAGMQTPSWECGVDLYNLWCEEEDKLIPLDMQLVLKQLLKDNGGAVTDLARKLGVSVGFIKQNLKVRRALRWEYASAIYNHALKVLGAETLLEKYHDQAA